MTPEVEAILREIFSYVIVLLPALTSVIASISGSALGHKKTKSSNLKVYKEIVDVKSMYEQTMPRMAEINEQTSNVVLQQKKDILELQAMVKDNIEQINKLSADVNRMIYECDKIRNDSQELIKWIKGDEKEVK